MTVAQAEARIPIWGRGSTELRENLWHHAVLALLVILVVGPILFLVLGSFSTARIPGVFSLDTMSIETYRRVWTDPGLVIVFYNTLLYVLWSTAFGVIVAIILAWLVERTDMPGKIWIYAGVPMTLAMPGLLQAMAWILLLSPRVGFVNQFFQQVVGTSGPVFNIYTLAGMIFVEGLRIVPTAYLMLVPLLRGMDPSLEEAAAASGAHPLSVVRKVSLRLMLPGLLAITIYQFLTAFESFEVPGLIGMPANILVFSTKIYLLLTRVSTQLPVFGQANALAMIYLVVAVVATYGYGRAIRRSERFAVITGKGYRPRPYRLGRLRYAALALVWGYILLSVVVPLAVLAYASFLPVLQAPSMKVLSVFTLGNYREVFSTDLIRRIVFNTIVMAATVATLTCILSLVISIIVVRSKFWGRRLLDQIAFLPSAIPGIVLGLAFLWFFLQTDKLGIPLFGSLWSIVIAFTVAFIPFGTRSLNAAILQIHREIEEAAYASGARQWRVMVKIFVPLLMPSLVGVWIWCILISVRVIGIPLILYEGAENQVLASLIWNMWEEGSVPKVAVIGVLLTAILLTLTLGLRLFGFGRAVATRP